MLRTHWRRNAIAYAMAGPMLIVFYLFVIYPLIQTFLYSFYDYDGFGSVFSAKFIGLDNFKNAIVNPDVHEAFWRSLYLAIMVTVLKIALGFMFALFLYQKTKGWKAFQVALYLPAIVPVVVSATLWKMIYDGNFGLLNSLLGAIGLDGLKHPWLNDPSTVMGALIATLVWVGMPLNMLILFSYMLRIPRDLLEASKIDGASALQSVGRIVFPLVLPAVLLLTVLSIADSFKAYDFILLFTNGGPAGSSMVLGLYSYQQAFSLNHYGYSSAVSLLALAFLAVVSTGLVSRINKHIHEF